VLTAHLQVSLSREIITHWEGKTSRRGRVQ
jgi:hypothetical protein